MLGLAKGRTLFHILVGLIALGFWEIVAIEGAPIMLKVSPARQAAAFRQGGSLFPVDARAMLQGNRATRQFKKQKRNLLCRKKRINCDP
jgi:hypothetical protein